jgi:peptidoglycan/LPS O-acetylase OafA/YrhL
MKLPERNLDILRAIAVAYVVICHVALNINGPTQGQVHGDTFGLLGRLGVLMFFTHTALVLMASIERLERSAQSRWDWMKQFYVRRAFRIYPLAILAVLVVVAAAIPVHVPHGQVAEPFQKPDALGFITNLLLVQNLADRGNVFGVMWSLPFEMQMYVVLPFCYLAARRSWQTLAAVCLGSVGLAMLWYWYPDSVPALWRFSVLRFGPSFLSGVVAYYLLGRTTPRFPAWTWAVVVAAITAGVLVTGVPYDTLWLQWVPGIILGGAIPLVRNAPPSWFTRITHRIAMYSYGIYLSHVALIWLWQTHFASLSTTQRWVGFASSLIVVPAVLYHLIEAPMIRLGARIFGRQPQPIESAGIVSVP